MRGRNLLALGLLGSGLLLGLAAHLRLPHRIGTLS